MDVKTHVLNFWKKYVRNNKKNPYARDIAEGLGLSLDVVKKAVDELKSSHNISSRRPITEKEKEAVEKVIHEHLEAEGCRPNARYIAEITDFSKTRVATIQNILLREGRIPRYSEPLKVRADTESGGENLKKDAAEVLSSWFTWAWRRRVPFVLSFLAFIASLLSVRFTALWALEFLPVFWALALSITLIGYSLISPWVMRYLRTKKSYLFLFVCGLLFAVVLLFSVVSTVVGQYNERNILDDSEVDTAHKREVLALIEEEIDRLKGLIDNDLEGAKVIYDKLGSMQNQWAVSDTVSAIDGESLADKDRRIQDLQERRMAILTEADVGGLVEGSTVGSFYSWIAGIFGLSPQAVEFWLSILPAIFLDVLAPVLWYLSGLGIGVDRGEDG